LPKPKLGDGNAHHSIGDVLFRYEDIDERFARSPITLDDRTTYLREALESQRLAEVGLEGLQEGGIENGQIVGADLCLRR
jgi:hypothetical protein